MLPPRPTFARLAAGLGVRFRKETSTRRGVVGYTAARPALALANFGLFVDP
jgi:hypothetical protein